MSNPVFRCKQFAMRQSLSAMKVGTDGILLGAWANVQNAAYALDIGTGTGLVALMLAQRSEAQITAIEIDAKAAGEAAQNVKNSPWNHKISILNCSLQDFTPKKHQKYDLVVCNPPFFENSLRPTGESRSLARHSENQSLPFEALTHHTRRLLAPEGRFVLILPAQSRNRFVSLAHNAGLHCNRQLTVFPQPGKPAKRVLLELAWQQKKFSVEEICIETHARHQYSQEYKKLTAPFYLDF